jgi:hypothetical protein
MEELLQLSLWSPTARGAIGEAIHYIRIVDSPGGGGFYPCNPFLPLVI